VYVNNADILHRNACGRPLRMVGRPQGAAARSLCGTGMTATVTATAAVTGSATGTAATDATRTVEATIGVETAGAIAGRVAQTGNASAIGRPHLAAASQSATCLRMRRWMSGLIRCAVLMCTLMTF
jgi:hypothetical protein